MSRIQSDPIKVTSDGKAGANDLRTVDVDQFLALLITELQHQDPLNPMDNSEMVQQINQIREISATNQLSDTLGAVLLGQNVATASGLIGKRVHALTDEAKNVEGVVDRVSIEKDENDEEQRTIRIHIGEDRIDVKNIREIVGETQEV
jgi:flagellar basal-body rod modification protein FlgD